MEGPEQRRAAHNMVDGKKKEKGDIRQGNHSLQKPTVALFVGQTLFLTSQLEAPVI